MTPLLVAKEEKEQRKLNEPRTKLLLLQSQRGFVAAVGFLISYECFKPGPSSEAPKSIRSFRLYDGRT